MTSENVFCEKHLKLLYNQETAFLELQQKDAVYTNMVLFFYFNSHHGETVISTAVSKAKNEL